MKRFTLLLALAFAFHPLAAQVPYFVQSLYTAKADVCYGETVTLSARVAQTTYFEFQLLEDGQWIRLSSGDTDTTATEITHLFASVHSSSTVRVLLKNTRSEITGTGLDIRIHQPAFDVNPSDLIQCNGREATFRASAPGAQAYQWESSTDGLTFSPLSITTKFKDVTTPALKVTGIINGHDGLVFRCRVTDAYQCEALSSPATLSVNQLSSAVSPTTTAPFCEGDTARFFPASVAGTVLSRQWWIRKAGQTTYSPLEESKRFTGTQSDSLRVNGILTDENSYRIRVGFLSLTQNPSGQRDSTVCYLESTRANYTVRPRPASPFPLDSLQSCGPSTFLISGTESYFWYDDTLASPIRKTSYFYETPRVDSSTFYYYSVKDEKGCESYRQSVPVFIRPIPAQTFSVPDGICPDATHVPLEMTNARHSPQFFFVEGLQLTATDSLPVAPYTNIALPSLITSDPLTLRIHSKNAWCTSDTTELRLQVFPVTRIHPTWQDITACEGESVQMQVHFDAHEPEFTWYKNGAVLANEPADSLLIPHVLPAHAGAYSVAVKGRCGEEQTPAAHLTVRPAVRILVHPKDTTLCENADALFQVKATGSDSLKYQWYINGQPVSGNSDILHLPGVSHSRNRAKVVCRVTSACAREIVSDTALLTVRTLPPPPGLNDTLVFCGTTVHLGQVESGLNWYTSGGELLPSPVVSAGEIHEKVFQATKTDQHGCESPAKPFFSRVFPPFTITALAEREEICLTGNFNRSVRIGTFTSTTDPVTFRLLHEGRLLESNTTGHFTVHEPGRYTVEGLQQHCPATDSLIILPSGVHLPSPPTVADREACSGQSVTLEASAPGDGGQLYWWNHPSDNQGITTGNRVTVPATDTVYYVSYGSLTDGFFCESPRAAVRIHTLPALSAGRIAGQSALNCAGYNPPVIQNLESPENATGVQWQYTENCSQPVWSDLPGATGLTFNPGVLQTTTCFRRKAWNRCDTLYSPGIALAIVPDPTLLISGNKDRIIADELLALQATRSGGTGNCLIQWQVNAVSAAVTNPNWVDIGTGEKFYYTRPDHHGPLHFRAGISCDLSSCNLATSNTLTVQFIQPTPLAIRSQTREMIQCYGSISSLQVQAEGMGTLTYRWQRKVTGDPAFTDLEDSGYLTGVQSPTLRISQTGNAESPHQALFRCVVSDTVNTLISAEIPLNVNRLTGNLPNQTLCAGSDVHADLQQAFTITGTPVQYEWQHRAGTGHPWQALNDTGNVAGSRTPALTVARLTELEQVQYRCAVTFTSSTGSCVETTDLMTLKVGSVPRPPEDIAYEICQNEKMQKITLYPPEGLKVNWYGLHEAPVLSRHPDIETDLPGDYFMQYTHVTDKKCESARALIRVTVHPAPPPPYNTTPEVYDETDALVFSAAGQHLKWYRTRTLNQFEPYPPVFTSPGKKSYYVTQTDNRGCESERLLIQSELRPVFNIVTQPADQANCDGNTVTFTVRTAGGTAVTYQWQREYYGVFGDLAGETGPNLKISAVGTTPDSDGTRYRCIVRSGGKQLVSEPARLIVNTLKPNLPGLSLCSGESIDFTQYRDSIRGTPLKIEWQRRTGNTYATRFEAGDLATPFTPEANETGSYRLRVTFPSSGGTCVRNSNTIPLVQHARPEAPKDTLIRICRFASPEAVAAFLPENTWWLSAEEDWLPSPELATDEEAEYRITCKTGGENQCYSEPVSLEIRVQTCYFAAQTDTTVAVVEPVLFPDEWNYLYLDNGEIFAAIHPRGQHLSPRAVEFTATRRPFFPDSSGHRFVPRKLSIYAATPFALPVKVRYYISENEWLNYPENPGTPVLLLHQHLAGSSRSADSTWWAKDTLQWTPATSLAYRYAEFEADSPGHFLLWRSRKPSGKLHLAKDAQGYPVVVPENLAIVQRGQYVVRKSADGTNWRELASGVSSKESLSDTDPYLPETRYRLDFDFSARIRAILDSGKIDFPGPPPVCQLLQNPPADKRAIHLAFPGLQKERTHLVSFQGQRIPILHITETEDYYRIHPATALQAGSYYLITTNREGQSCTKRIIVY